MIRYKAQFQETVSYCIWIDADSEEEAAERAQNMLTAGDLVDIDEMSIETDTFDLEFVQVLGTAQDLAPLYNEVQK